MAGGRFAVKGGLLDVAAAADVAVEAGGSDMVGESDTRLLRLGLWRKE